MDLLTEEEIREMGKKAVGGVDFTIEDSRIENKSDQVLGHLGKHLTLKLSLSSEGKRIEKVFFVKTYEAKQEKEDFLGESGIFRREQDFYRVVVEELKLRLGTIAWCPKYYFSKERVLVLEDLTEEGFRLAVSGEEQSALNLNEAHLVAALEALASLHASSLLLEKQTGRNLPSLYPGVFEKELLYDENKMNSPTRKWLGWQIKDLEEGVNYLPKYSQEEKEFIKANFQGQVMRIYALSKKSDKYRNVLTHGDMWKNNLLFRYSDQGEPVECRFVDFQFTRYAPPAHDLMHLLYFVAQKDARDRQLFHFLRHYHESLRKATGGEEIEREELEKSCADYKELALIQCLLSLHYLLGPVNLNANANVSSYDDYETYLLENRKKYVKTYFQDERYRSKVGELFQELIDSYIFK